MDKVRIRYIKEWISQLPSGNITYKTIKGKKYPYYQWTENGKQQTAKLFPKIIPGNEGDTAKEYTAYYVRKHNGIMVPFGKGHGIILILSYIFGV